MTLKNRGALSNPCGRFEIKTHEGYEDGWEPFDEEALPTLETTLYAEQAKSIITYNDSPDIGFDRSINPYQGCEHGCIYCYARPAHAYYNLSPGVDFETKIFYKANAAALLEKALSKPAYQCQSVMIGANTDPYQPAEARLRITRSLLETFLKYRHPIAIISKSSLIVRDLDLLAEMAKKKLVKVAISVTTLDLSLKQILEPRTSSPKARLRAIHKLSEAGIPVRVMAAPMIPMINDCELEEILKQASEAGAIHASYVMIRLPHEVKDLFKEWLNTHYPQRAAHVMSLIRQMRNGKEYDSTFGKRMEGEGIFAELLKQRFNNACHRYGLNVKSSDSLDTSHFIRPMKDTRQMEMDF